MHEFRFTKATAVADAIRASAQSMTAKGGATVRFVAGGTTLVDLMKLNVEKPALVVDINKLPLGQIESTPEGGLKIGALVRNSDLAHHPLIQSRYRVLSEALLAGASAQLRNMATTGGNLLQRTRCVYFRDTVWPCNKREPGSGCSAINGANRMMAILGTSDDCIATNPSDMNVALTALETTIGIAGLKGNREVPISEFFLKPGNTPQQETVLHPGDLITHITLGSPAPGSRSLYLKLRDRASYEFALSSAAIIATVTNNRIRHVRVALGGVGTVPWRAAEAEGVLLGKAPSQQIFRLAAEATLQGAKPQSENGFKVELAKRCLIQALNVATQTA